MGERQSMHAGTPHTVDHARIGVLIDYLLSELEEASPWVDECGHDALRSVERAKAMWAVAHAEDGEPLQ